MKLRTRIWTLVLGVMTTLLAVVALAGGWVLVVAWEEFEAADGIEEAQRVTVLLEQELEALTRGANDYAFWIEAVRYVRGEKPEFAEENFTVSSIENLAVSAILVHRTDGTLVGGVVVDRGTTVPRKAVAADTAPYAAEIDRLRFAPDGAATVSGLRRVGEELVLVACAPIRTEEISGTQGTMLFARRIDDAMLARCRQIASHDFVLRLGDLASVAGEGWQPVAGRDLAARYATRDSLLVRVPLRDTGGREIGAAVVTVELPLAARVRNTLLVFLAVLVGAFVGLGLLLTLFLRRAVVARIERLSGVMLAAADRPGAAARAAEDGDDEISGLGRQFNQLIDRFARWREEREQAHAERERLQTELFQAQKMEAVGEFAGGIAHDFNNALTSVTGWVALAREQLPPGHEAEESLRHASASAEHAGAVVGQLLAYSRQGVPALAPLELGELVEGSRTLLRSGLPRSVKLGIVQPSVPATIMADRTQVQQVLMNLVKNASDAMNGRGSVTIEVARLVLPAPTFPGAAGLPAGDYWRLSVRDDGPGIPAAHLGRMFEPFFTTKGAGKGTGLGLAVVRRVAMRHGGAVGVESTPGQGAHFHVYFPAAGAAPPNAATAPAGAANEKLGRVLVVEDDAAVLKVVVAVLQRRGYEVLTADDGQAGWREFESTRPAPELVLTDVTMPGLTGLQLGERIFNSGHPVPVVLMTAYATTLDRAQLQRAGFAGLVAKPIVFDELLAALEGARRAAKK